MTHTPGPWHTNTFDTVISTREDKRTETIVARCRLATGRQKEAIANARLIAAAPALLEACKAERAYWQHFSDCIVCKPGYECREAHRLWSDARKKRTTAIAQAKGEQ